MKSTTFADSLEPACRTLTSWELGRQRPAGGGSFDLEGVRSELDALSSFRLVLAPPLPERIRAIMIIPQNPRISKNKPDNSINCSK